MDTVDLCGSSAFRYHRIPPVLRPHIQDALDLSTRRGRRALSKFESYLGYIPLPLETMVADVSARHVVKCMRSSLWSGDMPSGAFEETDEAYVRVSSPLFTLLTMAPALSETELTMAMYEMCGEFTTIQLLPEHEKLVISMAAGDDLPGDGWIPHIERGEDGKKKVSSLWKRPALTTVDELRGYADATIGIRGHSKFAACAERIYGMTRSPFEVQAVMALSLPRGKGGEGFVPTGLNRRIGLTREAAKLVDSSCLEIDIFFEAADDHPDLAIECQGRMVHGAGGITAADSNRLNALERMGIDTLTLTHEQISNPARYASFMKLVASKLGVERRDKTKRQKRAENELHRNLFIAWETLGLGVSRHMTPKRFRK